VPAATIPETICTDQDVFDCAGGEASVAQLIDKDGDGRVDAGLLLAARRRATTEVLGMVENQSEILGLQEPYPRLWVFAAGWLALRGVWVPGTGGQAFPKHFQEEVDNVRNNILPLIRRGLAGNVAEKPPAINQTMTQVTHNSPWTLSGTKWMW